MAFFIVFEGGDGSGKTTQVRRLYSFLRRKQHPVRVVHEPGSTPLGESVRRLLGAWKRGGATLPPIVPEAELFLFEASRAQLVGEVIKPGLKQGTSIICDRYFYSTVAYQGYGRNLNMELINRMNKAATGGLQADLVIYLDMPPEVALERKDPTNDMSRFEREALAFHRHVRDGYLKQAADSPRCWFIVDAQLPEAEIARLIRERVEKLIKAKSR